DLVLGVEIALELHDIGDQPAISPLGRYRGIGSAGERRRQSSGRSRCHEASLESHARVPRWKEHATVAPCALESRRTGGGSPMSQEPEDRIARMLQDLRPDAPSPAAPQPAASLAERMAQLATPGASVAVIEDCDVRWARGFGVRTVGADAVTPQTLFQAGSV